jgi:hypothetical protein
VRCIVMGCERDRPPKTGGRGMCPLHYGRWRKYGSTDKPKTRVPVGWYTNALGYRAGTLTNNNLLQLEHIKIAEKVLGGSLPRGVEVHHVNGDPSDNHTPYNLVICQDHAYHKLLHTRQRAKVACGHVDWRPCAFCKEHDDPKRMVIFKRAMGKSQARFCHGSCRSYYNRTKQMPLAKVAA